MVSHEVDRNALGQKVAVAMSGGVDSSVAAALLIDEGFEVIGIMMRLWSEPAVKGHQQANRCCTPDQMADARRVADLLGIPFYVLDVQDFFREVVVDFYVREHLKGLTPNPCIRCNRYVRFELLLDHALALGADFLATGHFARINEVNGQYQLLEARDSHKDQSYVLHVLDQERLGKLMFPVGDYTKDEVRELAKRFGLPVATKDESMDLCFIADGNPKRFLSERPTFNVQPGPVFAQDGKLLGRHDGIPFYTIGQRKGLGIATGEPMYVIDKNADQNALILGTRDQLGRSSLHARQTNWVAGFPIAKGKRVGVKIRYRAKPAGVIVLNCSADEVSVKFLEPVYGITAGQGAVFYDDNVCLGGGIITNEDVQ
ncbi:MAG: tRNA 2-thiouridine(34) synthase MnmA [Candidatus Promineifilaceae bacterium]